MTIKLRGIPDTIAAAACSFETVEGACQAVILAIQTAIPVARIELLNVAQVRCCNAYSKLTLPETPLLLLEFHGSEAEVAEQSKNFRELAADCGSGDFTWTTRPEDRSKLWQARHDAYWSVRSLRPGAGVVATDVCVPISRLADCVVETEEDLKRLGLVAPIVGHVGDGNFHCSLLCDLEDAAEMARGDGEIITTGTRAKKSSAGYDLTHLFVGAEGTLGIISELTIKLRGIPDTIAAAACSFETVEGACQAVILAIQTAIPVARIELLNVAQVRCCNAYSKLTLPETPLLLLEFHGSEAEVAEQSKNFRELAAECGGGDFTWTTRPEDRSKLWQARHDAYWSVRALRPGAGVVATDVCVPISRLADCVVETEQDLKRLGLVAPIVGHVGDGNFHCSLLCDLEDAAEMARGDEFMHRLVERAQSMDGTCTGEHGIGQGKQKYLKAELGSEALDAMRAIKRALDPQNIFNPGKILPQA
ncbi:MAG TPA: FAD-linked oxidase C-terminal domain-containing protein [Rhodopseudomonas sp.]|uniref:FAD-binding oxidoreductase n=1 Tax=Rhodopseudomonas sp. TaxID=1078 RepID=UPI002ED9CF06